MNHIKFVLLLEVLGDEKIYLDKLRKAIPNIKRGIDLRIPSEKEILDSLEKLGTIPNRYSAVYNLLLDSGLRLVEGVSLINEFNGVNEINGFFRCNLGKFRWNKQAYYGHFFRTTLKKIKSVSEKIIVRNASHYFLKVLCQ